MASVSTTAAVKRKGKGKPKADDAPAEAAAPAAAAAADAPADAAPEAAAAAASSAGSAAGGGARGDRRDRDCAPAPAMRFVGVFAVLLTLVLCGVLYFLFSVLGDDLIAARDSGPEVMYPPDLPSVAVVGKVRRVRLPDDESYDFASTFSGAGQPVILTNTPADKWAAAQWTPKVIAAAVPELRNIQTHPNRTFYYFHAEHPLAHVQSIAAERKAITYERIEAMPTAEFFQRISRPVNTIDGEDYIYYASKVENFGELYFDMKPIDRFMVREKGAKDWERIETNVWIGPENATTHAHYDIQHSFYVQLQGSKRFLLWPPEQIDAMYIYPFLHPGHQSSQIDLEHVNYTDFPRFAQECRALEAILYPGDVMYLPPLWMHHVTALTPSMSISVWTSHAEHDIMDALEAQGLPFPPQWKLTQRIPGGLHLLRMILNHPDLRDRSGARAIVRALIANRYFRVFRDHPSVARNGFPDICTLPLARALRDPENAVSKSWAEFALNAVKSFNLMPNPARRTVWLRNYVEMVAHMSAGVERVGGFLRCLSEAATDDAAPAAVAVSVATEDAEPESDYE